MRVTHVCAYECSNKRRLEPPELLLLVTGAAGSGKSSALRKIMQRAAVSAAGEERILCAAPTGLAACNLPGGVTLHKLLALSVQPSDLLQSGPTVEFAERRLRSAWLVVIDEASQLDVVRLQQLDQRMRQWGDATRVRGVYACAHFDMHLHTRRRLAALDSC